MYTTGSPVMTFNRGGRLQLSVNIDSICDDNITSLAWYHNETRISSGRKFTISNHDTVLTGINMVSSDAGVYEVRISFNAICTDELVNYTSSLVPGCVLLQPETLAFIAPVTFIVQENCLPTYNPLRVVNVKYIYDESSHNITELRSTAHTNMSHRYNWYRNGLQLADSEIYITEGIIV